MTSHSPSCARRRAPFARLAHSTPSNPAALRWWSVFILATLVLARHFVPVPPSADDQASALAQVRLVGDPRVDSTVVSVATRAAAVSADASAILLASGSRSLSLVVRMQGPERSPFLLSRGAAADTIVLAYEGVAMLLRICHTVRSAAPDACAVDAAVAIALHELGHARLGRWRPLLGDRDEQWADDFMIAASARLGRLDRLELLAELLPMFAVDDDAYSAASRHGSVRARASHLRCMAAAITRGDARCRADWVEVQRSFE